MIKKYIHSKADELFWWFEQNRFVDSGNYPRNTNLIFAFSDFVDAITDEQILSTISFSGDIAEFRRTIKDGVDLWLALNSKTMTII